MDADSEGSIEWLGAIVLSSIKLVVVMRCGGVVGEMVVATLPILYKQNLMVIL